METTHVGESAGKSTLIFIFFKKKNFLCRPPRIDDGSQYLPFLGGGTLLFPSSPSPTIGYLYKPCGVRERVTEIDRPLPPPL